MKGFIGIVLLGLAACRGLAQQSRPAIAFASDTQQPMWVEKLFLKSNHNEMATSMIFQDVDQQRPAAFFILGDVVSLGYKNKTWTAVDSYIKQCAKDSIPVYATLGNHEVIFNAKRGTDNFRRRFPMYKPAGYSEVVDSVAVVLLNSNFSKMSAADIAAQDNWYTAALQQLDADPAVKCIIVGCHHSPYTKSKVVKPSPGVQQHFVPAFIRSKKCLLFLSGHSHNFERFSSQGKCFLVIGGGGGLHQPLHAKAVSRDLAADYKPMFHYLLIRRLGDSLQIVSRRLAPDFSGFSDGLSFSVK
jgi:hypothetical protein